MPFQLEDAIEIANQAAMNQCDRALTDVEVLILKGVWQRLEYDQIAAQAGYSTSYLGQDVAPKLWKLLSAELGEKVKKSNLKTVIQRRIQSDRLLYTSLNNKAPAFIASIPAKIVRAERCYIERPLIEKLFYEALLHPGALLRLKAPRFMGKTTLASHVLAQIAQVQYQVVQLSLDMADRTVHLTDINRFLRWFCLNITRSLGLPNQIDEYWETEDLGAKVSCTAYFEDYLLRQCELSSEGLRDRPLVLCLDDVDCLFPHPEVYEDFFGLLRSWHEKARTRQVWEKLRLVIIHSTDAYIRLKIKQSPFNVGQPIELPELNLTQISQMAQHHHVEVEPESLHKLVALVGGHPTLLKQFFTYLKTHPDASIETLLAEAATESSLFISHLREQLITLQMMPALAQSFQKIITSEQPFALDSLSIYQLQSMGLIILCGNHAMPRCQLYKQYFKERLYQHYE